MLSIPKLSQAIVIKNIISNKDTYSYFIEDDFAVKGTMHSIENILKLALNMEKKIILIFPTRNDLKRIENGENYKKLLWYKIMVNLTNKYSAKLIDLADYVSVEDHEKMTFECDGPLELIWPFICYQFDI